MYHGVVLVLPQKGLPWVVEHGVVLMLPTPSQKDHCQPLPLLLLHPCSPPSPPGNNAAISKAVGCRSGDGAGAGAGARAGAGAGAGAAAGAAPSPLPTLPLSPSTPAAAWAAASCALVWITKALTAAGVNSDELDAMVAALPIVVCKPKGLRLQSTLDGPVVTVNHQCIAIPHVYTTTLMPKLLLVSSNTTLYTRL